MTYDIVIEIWHHGGHWSIKKRDDQYWHKAKGEADWKSGLPPGMTDRDATRAFRSG